MNAFKKGSSEQHAADHPDRVCLVEDDRNLTYAAWEEQANRLAGALKAKGAVPGDKIAVRTGTRMEWFIINRAIAKVGGQHVALNWRLTPAELNYIVADSGSRFLFFDDENAVDFLEGIDTGRYQWIVAVHESQKDIRGVDHLSRILEESPADQIVGGGDAPFILYTSGTTGRPKGAVPDVSKLMANITEVTEYLQDMRGGGRSGASRKDSGPRQPPRTLLTMPLHHGAGTMSAQGTLRAGGTVYILRRFKAEKALKIISDNKVNSWSAVPTMLHRIRALPDEVRRQYDLSSMKNVGVGAAPVPFALKKWFVEEYGPCLSEGYGATEFGMATRLEPKDQLRKPGSCGRPYKHVHIRIMADEQTEAPVGEVGEVYVKTPMVITGYLNRDPLGQETLTEDGFFRSGDMGRVDEEGFLYITDRKKDMIISGGVNIYPAEIEAALIKHPDIIDAAVVGIPEEEFGEQVMAVIETETDLTVAAVQEFCKEELASYKIPAKIEFVRELPRNPMGKVLKNDLRAPHLSP